MLLICMQEKHTNFVSFFFGREETFFGCWSWALFPPLLYQLFDLSGWPFPLRLLVCWVQQQLSSLLSETRKHTTAPGRQGKYGEQR